MTILGGIVHHLENKLGVDLDGDGHVGKVQRIGGKHKHGHHGHSGHAHGGYSGQALGGHGGHGGHSNNHLRPQFAATTGCDPYAPMGAAIQPSPQQYGYQNPNMFSAPPAQYPQQVPQQYPQQYPQQFPQQQPYPQQQFPQQQPYPQQGQLDVHNHQRYPSPMAFPGYSSGHLGGGANRKALLIGINYTGQPSQLRGCVNDVSNMRKLLNNLGYADNQMTVLVDDPSWRTLQPTRRNIVNAFSQFSAGAKPGDILFFHFSGHGGKVRDTSGDENDGYDETIMPVDYAKAGQIVDDEVYAKLLHPLPQGCRMFALMDCCNSGTALDLPYRFVGDDNTMKNILQLGQGIPQMLFNAKFNKMNFMKFGQHVVNAALKNKKMNQGGLNFGNVAGALMGSGGNNGFHTESRNMCRADVVALGGCEDLKTSADVQGSHGAGGACTQAFIKVVSRNQNPTYIELLESTREELRARGLRQKPQLSASQRIEMASTAHLR